MQKNDFVQKGNLFLPTDFKKPKDLKKEVGKVGTDIFSGYIDLDLESKWKNLSTRVKTIKEMMSSHSSIEQILDAKKNPLLSAKYFLKPADESARAIELKDRIEENLFKRMNFQAWLQEVLTFYEMGFSLFAIIYEIKNGRINWKRFKFLEQNTIEQWTMNERPWIDGHPAGITQLTNAGDEEDSNDIPDEIPWDRLLRFTHKQIGNNYEGKSVLRSAYSHWFYIDLFQKIAGIYGERYGAGVPTLRFKRGTSESDKKEFIKMVQDLRANEQSYAVFEEGNELQIITPDGGGLQSFIVDFIRFQDKKIYDAVSAGFLNLTTGDGGSNALSKDQSSFFMRSLQADADYLLGIINNLIEKLIWLNAEPVELAPVLCVSDLGQISLDEYVDAIMKARQARVLTWTKQDEEKVRAQLKLDPRPEDAEPDYTMPNKSDEKTAGFERLKKKMIFTRVSSREKIFMRNISDHDNFLEAEYFEIDKIVKEAEAKYKKGLLATYDYADTKRIDGVSRVIDTPRNRLLKTKAIKFVDDLTRKLKNKLINSSLQNKLFDTSKKMAVRNLTDDEKSMMATSHIEVDQGKLNSFLNGYKSNMDGILFNEPRRIKENIIMVFGSQQSRELAKKQAESIFFNRNILKLSSLTHPLGAYNRILFDENIKRGFTHYKVLVPKRKIKTLSPTGVTAGLLFGIFTAAQINKKMSEQSDGKNAGATDGLNLHHGASAYFMPIFSEELEEEEEISREQRKEFKE